MDHLQLSEVRHPAVAIDGFLAYLLPEISMSFEYPGLAIGDNAPER